MINIGHGSGVLHKNRHFHDIDKVHQLFQVMYGINSLNRPSLHYNEVKAIHRVAAGRTVAGTVGEREGDRKNHPIIPGKDLLS